MKYKCNQTKTVKRRLCPQIERSYLLPRVYERMNSSLPRFRCLSLLHRNPKTLTHIKQIHAQLIINGYKSPSLFCKIIDNYCSLSSSSYSPQSTKLSHLVFRQFGQQNLFLLNTLLRCSIPENSIRLFAKWVSEKDFVFDEFTFIFVLGACARCCAASTLLFGRQVHGFILKQGVSSDCLLVGTTLVHFYSRNEDLFSARKVFDGMPERSNATWNAMISGYCSQKQKSRANAREALILFRKMLVGDFGAGPNDTTMVCVLSAITELGELENGACVHGHIEKSGFGFEDDVFIGTGLVDMYSKCGCLTSALCVFEKMKVRNIFTWTSMVKGLAVHGRGKEALDLLDEMAASGIKPNEVTFTSLFLACCHGGLVQEGLRLFQNMEKRFGVTPKLQHYGCIVDLLGRVGHLEEAYDFVLAMPVKPDAILWRSLSNACKIHGDAVMGEKVGKMLLELGQEQNYADMRVECEDYVALSNVYASMGKWQEVVMVRKEMKGRRIQTRPGCSLV